MQFNNWCNQNKLTLNLKKCKVMLLSGYSNNKIKEIKQGIDIKIGDSTLEVVKEYKYLGFMIDENLSYQAHVDMIRKKIAHKLYLLKKVRWVVGLQEALLIYKSSILPIADQGSTFYGSCEIGRLKNLQSLQNKALRTILGKKHWVNTATAHSDCSLLYLEDRPRMFLLKSGHLQSFIPSNLVRHQPRSLRSTRKILLKSDRPRNSKYEKSYVHTRTWYWNMLPEDLKKIRIVENFKTRIYKELVLGKLNFPE